MKQQDNGHGYMQVKFRVNNKQVTLLVHRIVATSFLPNPDNLPEVNHKDNNPKNNAVSNLEWCTSQYNTIYREKYGKSAAQVLGQPVFAVDLKTGKILRFETQTEAALQLSVSRRNISVVVNGKLNQTGGYWFCYADENAVEKTRAKFGDAVAKKVEKLMRQNQSQ